MAERRYSLPPLLVVGELYVEIDAIADCAEYVD